jgi:hypothetical protein
MAHGTTVRDRKKEAFWRKHIAGQRGSGESVRGYCRAHGLKEPAFYWWRSELARRAKPAAQTAFVPVHVVADAPNFIEITLAGGQQVRVSGPVERQALADVLAVLASSGK